MQMERACSLASEVYLQALLAFFLTSRHARHACYRFLSLVLVTGHAFFQRAWSRPAVLSEIEIRRTWRFLTNISRKSWGKLYEGDLQSHLPWSTTHCRQNHTLVWSDRSSSSDLIAFAGNRYQWPWEALVAVTVILASLAEGHTNPNRFSFGHAVCYLHSVTVYIITLYLFIEA